MSEIKVGEYVRTDEGIIEKCTETDNNYVYADDILSYNFKGDIEIPNCYIEKIRIVKHSKNIIDLIEVGDYVNGRLVLQVDYKNKNICLLIPFTDTKSNTNIMWYGYEEIKSIVTHEQFKNIEYKVGK